MLLVACVASALEIPKRGIDPDELEHLHAAYSVYRGDVPYRDFFEHHGPALYYLMQPLFWGFGAELNVLWWGRATMALCSLGTLLLTGLLARHVAGRNASLPAMCLLAWTTIFHTKAIELRPDVPATLLVVLAAFLALRAGSCRPGVAKNERGDMARHSGSVLLVVGIIGGIATLFTQKSVVPIAALSIAVGVQEARLFQKAGLLKALFRAPIFIALGGALAWTIAIALFALAGAADDLLYSTVYQLWIWPLRTDRWEHLRPTLAADLTVWFAAGMEVLTVARRWRDSETWKTHRGAISLVVTVCAASLLWAKATYAQYYLLWWPFVAVAAAGRLTAWTDGNHANAAFRRVELTAAALLVSVECGLVWRAVKLDTEGALARLLGLFATRMPLVVALALFVLTIAFIVAVRFQSRRWIVGLLASMGMFYAMLRNADQMQWSNETQVRSIAALNLEIAADETVLDGFTGYGALRPHAYYYWWINKYSVALMSPVERGPQLLRLLEQYPPAGVLYDDDLKLLPPAVQDWIRWYYRPANAPPLWLPRHE